MASAALTGSRPRRIREKDAPASLWLALLVLVVVQIGFVGYTWRIRPAIEEMPPPPSPLTVKAMALGDDEFLYRYLGYWLQGVGDGGGRLRPLREYDYDRVVAWMRTIDRLDERAEYIHQLATSYFGAERIDLGRVRKILAYLHGVAIEDPKHRWPYLVWCANIARDTLKDKELARALAADFGSDAMKAPTIPAWVRMIGVRLYAFVGDQKAATAAYEALSQADRDQVQNDINEMIRRSQHERHEPMDR